MTRRFLAWFLPALLLIVGVAIENGGVVRAQERDGRQDGQGRRSVRGVGRVRASLLEGRNEFILRAPADRIAAIAARRGLTVIRPLDEHAHDVFLVSGPSRFGSRFERLRDADKPAVEQLVNEVGDDADVAQFELNAVVVTPEIAAGFNLNGSTVSILDALSDRTVVDYFGGQVWNGYANQPATSAIRLAASHGAGTTGAGIVAVIDTGVDPHHPLLAGSLVPGYDFVNDVAGDASEWTDLDGSTVSILDGSTVSILDQQSVILLNGSTVAILDQDAAAALNPSLLPDAFGHGTMVAGLVHLVAPTAKIMPLKAFRSDGTSSVFDIVRAIHYAIDHGARVINMSFSATAASPEIAHAINVATSSGIVCVASAGNLGEEVLVYPGALRNVLGVGSTTTATPPTRSLFSNYGAALVSLGAPGEGVITTYPGGGYAGVWGTSFSAPLTAGAAALLLQVDPTLDQSKADHLLGNADRMDAGMGKGRLNLDGAVRALPDATPPAVTLTSPSGGVLFGSVVVSASASDNVGVAGVRFLLNNNPLGAEDTAAPYELTWPTGTTSNGTHALTAVARDAAGNQNSSVVSVTVSNDTTAPTVALTSPGTGATVNGTVTVSATASDDLEVFGVQFKLDGAPLGAEDATPPYELTWTTTTTVDGAHTLTAVARDAAGHSTAASVSVTVANTPSDSIAPAVALHSPDAASTVFGTVMVAATAWDNLGVVSVEFLLDGTPLGAADLEAPYQLMWPTLSAANGAHTLTAIARDGAGNQTTATGISVTVANDTTVPTVALTSPAAASSVSGTVTVAATASDDVGVLRVAFLLDGVSLGVDHDAPYELAWPTAAVANGVHTITAVSRDAAGNQSPAASVSVTVANDTTAPTVAMYSPDAASTVIGTVMVAATAWDNVGVVSVEFLLDGAPLGAADLAAPYQVMWPTATAANGTHTITAVARDAMGHATTATSISVTVANDSTAPTVVLTSPAAASIVDDEWEMVAATASDNVGVVSVEFLVDGTPLGAADLFAPYSVWWRAKDSGDGVHTLTAVARDAAGNATSTTVSVVVD
jgi:subtilisin family serine protease